MKQVKKNLLICNKQFIVFSDTVQINNTPQLSGTIRLGIIIF